MTNINMVQPGNWSGKSLIIIVSLWLLSTLPLQLNARTNSLVSYREALEKTREAQTSLAARDSNFYSHHRPRPGRNMCARSHVINTPVKRFESYRKPVYRSFTHACQSDATQTCKSYRILYETAYRSVYKAVPHTETVFECCPGWTRSSSSYDCTKAICSPGCKNGGTCVKPNHCICTSGWSGDTCETDVDECSKKVKSCEHDCINTPGSYRCQCHNGFILQSDAKSCRINLLDDPEYQRFLQGYQELNQRVFVLEKIQKKHNLTDLEHRIKKITESISFIKRNHASPSRGLEGTTQVLNYPFYGSPWERVHSLSEQISMLEERLEDCTCSQERRNSRRRPWM